MGTFHWLKVRLFCYSTEDRSRLGTVMGNLVGEGFEEEITEGHHGNPIVIMHSETVRDRDARALFSSLGEDLLTDISDDLDRMVDDDCTFHLRLDKQAAVAEEYRIAHHGDVISVTAKIVSHPARRTVAVDNMRTFLGSL